MNPKLTHVEIRKIRATVFTAFGMLTFFLLLGFFLHMTSAEVLPPLTLLIAMIFGSSSAFGIRKDDFRSAEEILPVDSRMKVWNSYLVSAAFLVIFVLGILLISVFEIVFRVQELGQLSLWSFIGMIFYLHVLSFLFTYWIKQPITGSGIAFLIAAGTLALIFLSTKNADHQSAGLIFLPNYVGQIFLLLRSLVSSVTFLWCLALSAPIIGIFAKRIERGAKLPIQFVGGCILVLLLPLIFPLSLNLLSSYIDRLRTEELLPVNVNSWENAACCKINGSLMTTQKGRIVYVDRSGQKKALYTPVDETQVLDIKIDPKQNIWALSKHSSGETEVLTGNVANGLRHFALLKEKLELKRNNADDLVLCKLQDGLYSYSKLAEKQSLNWIVGLPELSSQQLSSFVEQDPIPQNAYVDHIESNDGVYYISDRTIYLDDFSHHVTKISTAQIH